MQHERTDHSVDPQPPPMHNDNPSCHDLVIADMLERKAFGLKKYGTVLQAGNGRDFIVDAYQEILDMAVYLRGVIYERDSMGERVAAKPVAPIEAQFDEHGRNWISPSYRFRHKKTGGVYRIITAARIEATLEPVVVYYNVEGPEAVTFVRPLSEWMDGRFEII